MINRQIKRVLAKDPAITAAYLFGSYAKGRADKYSDVDVAVLFSDSLPAERYCDKQLRLMQIISDAVGREADVTVLNRAATFLKYQILKDGVRIYERPDRKGRFFEGRAIMEYFDYLPLRTMIEKAMIKRIREAH